MGEGVRVVPVTTIAVGAEVLTDLNGWQKLARIDTFDDPRDGRPGRQFTFKNEDDEDGLIQLYGDHESLPVKFAEGVSIWA